LELGKTFLFFLYYCTMKTTILEKFALFLYYCRMKTTKIGTLVWKKLSLSFIIIGFFFFFYSFKMKITCFLIGKTNSFFCIFHHFYKFM
jgi:hypothetical protein